MFKEKLKKLLKSTKRNKSHMNFRFLNWNNKNSKDNNLLLNKYKKLHKSLKCFKMILKERFQKRRNYLSSRQYKERQEFKIKIWLWRRWKEKITNCQKITNNLIPNLMNSKKLSNKEWKIWRFSFKITNLRWMNRKWRVINKFKSRK